MSRSLWYRNTVAASDHSAFPLLNSSTAKTRPRFRHIRLAAIRISSAAARSPAITRRADQLAAARANWSAPIRERTTLVHACSSNFAITRIWPRAHGDRPAEPERPRLLLKRKCETEQAFPSSLLVSGSLCLLAFVAGARWYTLAFEMIVVCKGGYFRGGLGLSAKA